jgi:hypothetical protein
MQMPEQHCTTVCARKWDRARQVPVEDRGQHVDVARWVIDPPDDLLGRDVLQSCRPKGHAQVSAALMHTIERFGKPAQFVERACRLERPPVGDEVLRRHNSSHAPIISDRRNGA